MSESCRIAPVVHKRNGTKIEEKPSKLFKDIKEAVQDYDAAWNMWAYTKTPEFKQKYKDLEYDELGEVTFASFIQAMGLQQTYDEQKSIKEVSRDYGFTDEVFPTADVATSKINEFNSKEKNHVALIERVDNGYKITVVPKTGPNVNEARDTSYNYALTGEIIRLLQSIGFNVQWVSNPKFEGLFDPTNAKLYDGLLNVISIARGELGENALPEEFSHLIIEGLINHPLVQRLLATITDEDVHDVLGDQYDAYNDRYEGDSAMMKKETAGKMLGQYITKQGTISQPVMQPKQNLLSRIWNWAKKLFSRITGRHIEHAKNTAYDTVANIYNMVSSGEALTILDKHSILNADTMYKLTEDFADLEKIARKGENILAKMHAYEQHKSKSNRATEKTTKTLEEVRNLNEGDTFITSTITFLKYIKDQLIAINKEATELTQQESSGKVTGRDLYKKLASISEEIKQLTAAYEHYLNTVVVIDEDGVWDVELGIKNKLNAEQITKVAKECRDALNSLNVWSDSAKAKIVVNESRAVLKNDIVRGIGAKREECMCLSEILEHAKEDINFVDRWFTAMSDASDELLVIFDQIVKNQQYDRDMEMLEWRRQIAAIDEKLRKAGESSDFMFERKPDGTPTGRIISQYDWTGYNEALRAEQQRARETAKTSTQYYKIIDDWRNGSVNGKPRLITVFVDPKIDEQYRKTGKAPEDAVFERMPNPEVFSGKAQTLNSLNSAQKEYYEEMIRIKREMMTKIPHRGQAIYKAIYISKNFIEGIVESTNPLKATEDNLKRKFVRRPDDIGFGTGDDFVDDITTIIKEEEDAQKAADKILDMLELALDTSIVGIIPSRNVRNAIKKNIGKRTKEDIAKATAAVMEVLQNASFAIIDTDFADHKIQRLPIYYTRPLRDMNMLSTDFSGSMVAYSAMAVNYEKMDEVIDILQVFKDYVKDREIKEKEGNKATKWVHEALGHVYSKFVTTAGRGSNIAGRLDDYMASVIYEQRKKDAGSFNILGVNLDTAKTLDTIKDYTGLLGLGFNVFSTISNVGMGKLQQWIEAAAGEYFNVKHYAKAVAQYTELMPGCLAEMANPIKKNKLSLLIEMFDPMGEYYENLRDASMNKSAVTRILGNGVLAYIGMNAGEHLLHCQTMLAILNSTMLTNTETGEEVSLFDALEVKEHNGVYRLELQPNLSYERELIDNTGKPETNKNYGKPLRDENGKIRTEWVKISSTIPEDDQKKIAKQYRDFMFRRKKVIRKVNDSLNGAFNVNDKGAIHRAALGRLVMQFRQWMPAHYMRRFAGAHYDADLEQWREGYYITVWNVMNQLAKEVKNATWEFAKIESSLSKHEKANLRRANAEIAEFLTFMIICRLGGHVKDRDRSWLNKMALYQANRMKLEVGASMPINGEFFNNILTLLQQPSASIKTFENFSKVLQFWNMFDEVQSGRYQGWSEWERDLIQATPGLGQALKAINFDESMFSMFENKK